MNGRFIALRALRFVTGLAPLATTTLSMKFHKLGDLETRPLQNLNLSNADIPQWVDAVARLLDILGDGVRNEFVDNLTKFRVGHITGDDFTHLLPDCTDLGVLSVAGLALAERVLVGESDAEHTEQVSVGGLHVNVGLDQGLPFLDHPSELVSGEIHAVEVAEHIASLNIFSDQTELAERPFSISISLKIGQRYFKDTALQTLRSDFGALSTVDKGGSHLSLGEHRRSLDIVPIFTGEGIDDLLLNTLFTAFRQAFIFTPSHLLVRAGLAGGAV